LKNIHAGSQTSDSITFGDTTQLAEANGGSGAAHTGPLAWTLGFGADQLGEYSSILPPLTGFDPSSATSAISVGNPPNLVSVLYGSFDPAAIGTKLAAWGYHKQDRGGGVTAWVFADDHKIDMTKLDPDTGVGPGMGGWLNVIWVSKTSIAYGRATSDLAAAVPAQSTSLADDPMIGSLADCLGSPLAVMLLTGQKQIQSSAVTGIAFGITGTGTADLQEEICVAAPDAAGAQTLAAGFTKAVGSGFDYRLAQPFSAMFSAPQTKVIGGSAHVVRLSAKPVAGQDPTVLFKMVQESDFLSLLGLPEVVQRGGAPVTLAPSFVGGAGSNTPSDSGSDAMSPTPSSS
jgi:hypothetical protein